MSENNYPTPHINASPSDFAETVLMPGDPLRSKFIAENFLNSPKLINEVRGIMGYTGTYKGKKVSVMASGMGMPSIGIYSYELFNFFGVQNIIRVGSAGAMQKELEIGELVIAMSASTNSNYAHQFGLPGTYSPTASYQLMKKAINCSEKNNIKYTVGNVLSTDTFYNADSEASKKWMKMGVLAVEMETAALYMNAAYANKNALALLSISDSLITGEALNAYDRQTKFTDMIKTALDIA